MTPRIRPTFRPSLLELERRDVPAWWAVSLPSPPEGTPGVTDAVHSGELIFNPDYIPENGVVTVAAATAFEAVAKALDGIISVTFDGETVDHRFGPDTMGLSPADHKPFLAVMSGSTVGLSGSGPMAGTGVV